MAKKPPPTFPGPFTRDVASVVVKHLTPAQMLKRVEKLKGTQGPLYLRTARKTGWMTDGRVSYRMPDRECVRVRECEPPPDGRTIEIDLFNRGEAKKCDSGPAEVRGVWPGTKAQAPEYHLTANECRRHAICNAVLYRTVLNRHPAATVHLPADPDDPFVFRVAGEVVGVLQPLARIRKGMGIPYVEVP